MIPPFFSVASVALTLSQDMSLWAIRCSLIFLAVGFWIQIHRSHRNTSGIAKLWLAGAALASVHTISAVWAFHQGSHANAVESTAQRTQEMFGVRTGYGIYANYAFVAIWWLDTAVRAVWLRRPARWLERAIDGFLIAMAVFGAIVFASGPIRYVGLACVAVGIVLWLRSRPCSDKYD